MWCLFLLLTCSTYGQASEQEIKVEFEETLGGMVEAMTEIQGRADAMMEEIKTREASISSTALFNFLYLLIVNVIIRWFVLSFDIGMQYIHN